MLTDTLIISNTAALNGGGAYANSDIQLSGSRFEKNLSLTGRGGGLYNNSSLMAHQTTFLSNTAVLSGGGAYVDFRVAIRESVFVGNKTFSHGGGLWADHHIIVTNTQFINNTATDDGGGLYQLTDPNPNRQRNGLLLNTLFARNYAEGNGSALYLGATGIITLLHSTIASPTLAGGQAIYVAGGDVNITNTIVASYTTGISVAGGIVSEDYNLFSGNPTDIDGAVASGGHSLIGDPASRDPAADDHHLTWRSAALDAGADAGVFTDFEGDSRPLNNGFDIGYDETFFYSDLAIQKNVTPTSAYPGQPVTYTLLFTNSGNQPVTDTLITDVMPITLTDVGFVSSGIGITLTGSVSYTWQAAELLPGQRGFITLTGVISPELNTDTPVVNTVSITASLDLTSTNNIAQAPLDVTVPRLGFSASSYSVVESNGPILITATLDTANPYADVSAAYSVVDGSATAGEDYIGGNGVLTIPAGQAILTLTIPISDDALAEGDETILLALSNPAGGAPDQPFTATLTILDEDASGVVINPITVSVSESGLTDAYQIVLTSQPTSEVTITISADDQLAPIPAVIFISGDWMSPQRITIAADDDNLVEGTHTAVISHAVISDDPNYDGLKLDTVLVSIADDDTVDLRLSKTVTPTVVLPGQVITYTLNFSNAGTGLAQGVVISDQLPGELIAADFAGSGAAITPTGGVSYTWQVDNLGSGQGGVITLTGLLDPILALDTLFSNTATITASTSETDLSNNRASITNTSVDSFCVYTHDFESVVGDEWSIATIATTPDGRNFLGDFSNQTIRLGLDDLPGHASVTLMFDLFIIRSWDGNTVGANGNPIGPDQWYLELNGTSLLRTTFGNWDTLSQAQAYPGIYPGDSFPTRTGAAENNTLGYTYTDLPMDSVYRLAFDFAHSNNTLDLDFSASGLQALDDESWGLDNVRVCLTGGIGEAPDNLYLPIVLK